MKKKLIALLCALSMLATSVVAIAEDAEVLAETEVEAAQQIPEEQQEEIAETQDEEPADEDQDSQEEISDETDAEEGEIDEIIDDEQEGDSAGTFSLMSEPVAVTVETDKDELGELLEDANAVTAEMVSASVFSALTSAITAAQAVYDDAEATQDAVDAQVTALAAKLDSAIQGTRDKLFETLKEYKGLDGGILDPALYGAYEQAYKAGKAAFWDAEKTAAELYALAADIIATYDAAKNALTAREKILSGNVKTEADKVYYPNMSSDTLPNLTYKWAADANPEAAGQDAYGDNGRMLNGVGLTPYNNAPAICWGKWSWHGSNNIDFNLGEEAYVTGADFWERACANSGSGAGTIYCSDKVAAYTSNDGETWTLQKEVTVDQSDCPNSLKGTRVDFDAPVKCRYVRVAVIDNAGYQVMYNEVVLRGYRTTQVETAPFVIEDIDYRTTKRIISLDGVSRVTITGKVRNTTSEEKTVTVISAAYKDGDLLALACSESTIVGFGTGSFSYRINLGGETDVTLHTFVWDNFTDTNALSKIETFGAGEHEMASVIAPSDEGAAFDIGSERLTVWGRTSASGLLKDVTLLVLKAGITAADMADLSTTERKNAIVYLEQTSPESGRYAFESFPQDTSSAYGNNNVYVNEQDQDQTFYRLLYLDNTKAAAIVNAFHGAGDAEAMRTVINNNRVLINGVKAVDDIIAKYDEDTVLDSVAGMILDTEYDTTDELLEEILAAVALTDLNNVGTREEAIESIDTYCEEFGIKNNGIYTKLYNGKDYRDFKNTVSDKFVGQNYASIKSFIAEFCEQIVVDMLNDATNYTDVAKVLFADTDYIESIGFNMDGYNRLAPSKQIRVQKLVTKHGRFTDMDSVKEAFNKAVANPGDDKTYGSSGGGGGFSGSSSLGTSVPLSGVTADDVSVFKDLSGAEWARESILALHKKGIVSGMTENTFAPNEDVTREQFTKMLVEAFDLSDASAECAFGDVDEDAWYYSAIASAVKNGIVYGITEGDFGVGVKITREDMAVLAYRVLVAKGNKVIYDKSQISDFTDDADISEYAREAVYAMRGNSIMLGRGNNEFQPKAQATRAEAAKIIYSIMSK